MLIRKIVTAAAVLAVIIFMALMLRFFLTGQPQSILYWWSVLGFSLPAFVLVGLLLLSFRWTGRRYLWLLLVSAAALVLLALISPPARLTSPVALLMLAILYLSDRGRGRAVPGA